MFHFRWEALGHVLKPKKQRTVERRGECWGSLLNLEGSFYQKGTPFPVGRMYGKLAAVQAGAWISSGTEK